jgi:hypothetical protein
MIYESKSIARVIALEWLAEQGIDDLDIQVTEIAEGTFGDETIVRYSVNLPRFGRSNGCLFIPNSFYLFRAWQLANESAPVAA